MRSKTKKENPQRPSSSSLVPRKEFATIITTNDAVNNATLESRKTFPETIARGAREEQ
jgi:hypothetical protein